MSIRTKIVLFLLVLGLSEAVLLGSIGYLSVSSVSRNAAELRRIGSAIEGARALNASLVQLTDPGDLLLRNRSTAARRFEAASVDLEGQILNCSATTCHGYEKRPPQMAGPVLEKLRGIRRTGLEILGDPGGGAEALDRWTRTVDLPARQLTGMTEEMSLGLMAKARELEASARSTERSGGLMVAFASAACMLAAVALSYPIARSLTGGLEALADQSRRITGGDLALRAREEGPVELVQLARAYNAMLDELSERRRRMQEHGDRLEAEVRERLAQLRRSDEQLKRSERLASVGLVAGTVAHDLNNPLTNILLNTEVLADAVERDEKLQEVAADIRRDAQRCRQIAGEIRELGREGEVEFAPFDLAETLREAVRLLAYKSEPRRVRVAAEFGPAPCVGSAPRLLQVFVNLVDNAVDASPDGGEVALRIFPRGPDLVVEVEDRGAGIPPELRGRLFRALYTTKPQGTGLGLAIARRIVEQHEGRIEVESRTAAEPGTPGTLFRVILPAEGAKRGGR